MSGNVFLENARAKESTVYTIDLLKVFILLIKWLYGEHIMFSSYDTIYESCLRKIIWLNHILQPMFQG